MTGGASGDAAGWSGQGGFGAASRGFGFSGDGFDGGRQAQTFGLAELRERLKGGFAVSLNQPLTPANGLTQDTSALDERMQLTFWGQGAPGFSTSTMFWGLDATHGERWMTGFAFAESAHSATSALSRGETEVSGFAESEVTAVYPYAKGRLGSGLELWSLAGWGRGLVDSRWTGRSALSGSDELIALHGDLAFSMGVAFTVSPGWGTQVSQEAGLMDGLGEDATAASTSPHAYLDGRVSWGTRIGGLVAPRETLRSGLSQGSRSARRHPIDTRVFVQQPHGGRQGSAQGRRSWNQSAFGLMTDGGVEVHGMVRNYYFFLYIPYS